MPDISTLVEDIYSLFDPEKHHVPNEENITAFCENIGSLLRTKLGARPPDESPLRFSNLGKPDRQLWYIAQGTPREDMNPHTYFKFLYGDVIEQLVLFLAKEAGHSVEKEQLEIEVDGVKGHIDAIIDGVVVDVKSASPFGYKKFKEGNHITEDPFGYIPQIAGYTNVLTPDSGAAFIAFDKVSGAICVADVSASVIEALPPAPRIAHLKAVITSPIPPPRCYPDEEDGKSGNRKLGTGCSYCAFKQECWPGLRTFIYSNGPRYLTEVKRVPDVPEV